MIAKWTAKKRREEAAKWRLVAAYVERNPVSPGLCYAAWRHTCHRASAILDPWERESPSRGRDAYWANTERRGIESSIHLAQKPENRRLRATIAEFIAVTIETGDVL
jgi:hypothetical protein